MSDSPAPSTAWSQRYQRRHAELAALNRLRTLVDKDSHASDAATQVFIAGRQIVNFGGNDYLNLAKDATVLAGATAALAQFGASAGGSRLLSGQMPIHAALEAALAHLKNKPRALVFPSGYQAAVTLLSTLCGLAATRPQVLLDKLCHASLIDGTVLGQARFQRFKHNSATDLEKYLARHADGACIVVVESIYSMDGDAAPLTEIAAACRQRQALLVIDDAHATGVLGTGGCGLTAEFAADENVIVLGTLSKALGAQGGFVAAHAWAVDLLIQQGRGFLYSTGLAPAAAGAALAAVERLPALDAARARLTAGRAQLLAAFAAYLPAGIHPAAAIVPVVVGEDARAVAVSDGLLADGFYVPAVRPPTVPPGTARLRISLSAGVTAEQITALIAAIRRWL